MVLLCCGTRHTTRRARIVRAVAGWRWGKRVVKYPFIDGGGLPPWWTARDHHDQESQEDQDCDDEHRVQPRRRHAHREDEQPKCQSDNKEENNKEVLKQLFSIGGADAPFQFIFTDCW